MKIYSTLFALITSLTTTVNAQVHGHLNIGAAGTNQNDLLVFVNGADFATNSLYVKTLTYTNAGKYAGYFQGNITLTGLAATSQFGGPEEGASALGSYLFAQIVSVKGPADGSFGFWENGALAPTFSIPSGTTSTNTYRITESNGAADADPYGHIHGRRFTATRPGLYTVTFRALDLSTNGTGGGPIHLPSSDLQIHFQAGINITAITRSGTTNQITFGSVQGRTFVVEKTSDLSATNWLQTSNLLPGNDYLQTVSDTETGSSQTFYRLRVTTP